MTEAWMNRGAERQKLLQELQHMMWSVEDEVANPRYWRADVSRAFLDQLVHVSDSTSMHRMNTTTDALPKAHVDRLLELIAGFARTPEEGNALCAELYLWHAGQIAHPLQAKLQTQELREPEKVFDGHQAMDKV